MQFPKRYLHVSLLTFAGGLSIWFSAADGTSAAKHVTLGPPRVTVQVSLAKNLPSPVSGRLLILLTRKTVEGPEIVPDYRDPSAVWIEALEIRDMRAGQTIKLACCVTSYPDNFSKLPAGKYRGMAILDVNHDFAYSGISGGDLRGPVADLGQFAAGAAPTIRLSLDSIVPSQTIQAADSVDVIQFESAFLSAFWGQPIRMNAAVVLPPSYRNGQNHRYPTMYWTHGFTATFAGIVNREARAFLDGMASGRLPEMIYVLLDQHCSGGTHEFADSVNNGPWGRALTQELIPYLEQKYRMDARPSGRLLNGHSSGGWAVLWLQVAYPEFFGGAWPTAPDPPDFHNFTGPDLLASPPQNFYRRPDGSPRMLVRLGGKDTVSIEDFARQEEVEGSYGGQFASFEWVFSPRAPDGTPQKLFDRRTGNIDPQVAHTWEKYDLASIVRNNADRLRPLLQGKIHLTVGTLDTFHLDEPARLFEKTLKDVGISADFVYLEGRDHFNLYQGGVMEKITQEMMQVARPQSGKQGSQ